MPACLYHIKQALTRYKRGCIISHEQPPFLSFIRGINYLELTYVNVVTATLVLGATPQSNAK
ncbi:hypothetical protein M2273_004854 [Mucilaginibacter lappiensis]